MKRTKPYRIFHVIVEQRPRVPVCPTLIGSTAELTLLHRVHGWRGDNGINNKQNKNTRVLNSIVKKCHTAGRKRVPHCGMRTRGHRRSIPSYHDVPVTRLRRRSLE